MACLTLQTLRHLLGIALLLPAELLRPTVECAEGTGRGSAAASEFLRQDVPEYGMIKLIELFIVFAATSFWVTAALYWGLYFARKALER